MAQAPKTWILTGSPENFAATRERGFRLIGMKERRRNQALAMAPGDPVSDADAELLLDRLRTAAGVPA
jgi:hypothetical protein